MRTSTALLLAASVLCMPAAARERAAWKDAFIDPLGRLWDAEGEQDGFTRWFATTDLDGDGLIGPAEITRAAQGWFATLDLNGDGQIDPDEQLAYEENRGGPSRPAPPPGPPPQGGGAPPAARPDMPPPPSHGRHPPRDEDVARIQALMDSRNPVASADMNLDRGVSQTEAVQTALRRLKLLDVDGDGRLSREEAVDRMRAQAAHRRAPPADADRPSGAPMADGNPM